MANSIHPTSSTLTAFLSTACDHGQSNDYWNLDDILAEEETIPCNFKVDAKGLSYLD
jgi:hypothetical protein